MNEGPVIALLGISGSGKSTLARAIARARPEILRLTASQLLKSSLRTTGERLRTAEANTILDNQLRLVGALSEARQGQQQRPVLLEAHAFIDNDRELIDVPASVMSGLGVAAILAIEASASEILRRRHADVRKRPDRSVEELARQQIHSREVERRFAEQLGVPLRTVASEDCEGALAFIDAVTRKSMSRTR